MRTHLLLHNRILSVIVLVMCLGHGYGQNLVLNPSFETYTECPTFNELYKATNWTNPNQGSPDFFACTMGPAPFYGNSTSVPANQWGYQQPHTGNCYAGWGTWDRAMARFAGGNYPNDEAIREYVQGKLSSSLVAGQTYAIEFWLSMANGQYGSVYALDQIGIGFSNAAVSQANGANLNIPVSAQTAPGFFFTDTLNWMHVSLCYKAVGNERFFSIGCFQDTNTYSFIQVKPPASTNWGDNRVFYYIDDVSVKPIGAMTSNFTFTAACQGLSSSFTSAVSTPACGSGHTYDWNFGDGTAHSAAANPTHVFQAPGTYNVTMTVTVGGMTQTVTKPVTILASPSVMIAGNTTVCEGQSTSLTAAGGGTYLWGPAANVSPPNAASTSVTPVTTSTYTLRVTGANGCYRDTSVVVTVNPPSDPGTDAQIAFCRDAAPVNLFSLLGGSPDTGGSWTDIDASGALSGTGDQMVFSPQSGVAGAVYHFQYTVAGNTPCPDTSAVVTVTLHPDIISLSAIIGAEHCSLADGQIDLNPVGGSSPYLYSSSGAITMPHTGLATGSYPITVTDANGCSRDTTIVVPAESGISALIATILPTACSGPTGSIETTAVTGGTAPYSFSLNGSTFQTDPLFTGLPAATAQLTVLDIYGCLFDTMLTVPEMAPPFAINAAISSESCGQADGSIEVVVVSGGSAPYQYSLNGNAYGLNTVFDLLAAGSSTISVQDANGCVFDTNLVVNGTDGPGQIQTSVANATCGSANGSIEITGVSGGTASYTYAINGGGFGAATQFSDLTDATYTITVEDANGCRLDTVLTVFNTPPVTGVSLLTTPTACSNATGTIEVTGISGGSGPYDYSLDATVFQSEGLFPDLPAGVQLVTVEDAEGCRYDTLIAILSASGPTGIQTTMTEVLCGASDGSITIDLVQDGTGPYVYAIDGGAFGTAAVFSDLSAGDHTIAVNDANGCSWSGPVTVSAADGITAVAVAVNASNCGMSNGALDVTAIGGTAPYQYTIDGTSFQSESLFDALIAGTYTVMVTDANGCEFQSSIDLADLAGPAGSLLSYTDITCNGASDGTATAQVSGGSGAISWSWNTNPVQTTASAVGLGPGNYLCTIIDSAGCSSIVPVLILEPEAVSLTTSTTPTACGMTDGTATVNAVGGNGTYDYSWDTTPEQQSATATGLASTQSYTATVIDGNGCSASATVNIAVLDGPAVTLQDATAVDCHDGNNGSITVAATGGTGTLSYQWNTTPVQTSATATTLSAGTYTVTVSDEGGCEVTFSYELENPAELVLALNAVHETCGLHNGQIDAQLTGGTGIPDFAWNTTPPQTTEDISGLSPGTYTLTVSDENGCQISGVAIINAGTPINVAIIGSMQYCSSGSAMLQADGNFVSYTWSTGATTSEINATIADNPVSLTVADANGCTATSDEVVVSETTVVSTNTSIEICEGESTVIHGQSQTIPGNYSQTFPASGGCDSVSNVTLVIHALPLVNAGSDQAVCPGGSVVLSGSGAMTYGWSGNVTDGSAFVPAMSLVYTLTGTDTNGCVAADQVSVTVNSLPVIDAGPDQQVCKGVPVILAASGAVTYQWTGGVTDGQSFIQPVGTTEYVVTGTDANGCTSQDSTEVTVFPNPPVVAGPDQSLCEGTATIVTASGAMSYDWTYNVTDGVPFVPDSTTTYHVTGTDENGCAELDSLIIAVDTIATPEMSESGLAGCIPIAVTFSNQTPGSVNCTWTFSDGVVVEGCSPFVRIFTEPGCYDVTLNTISAADCSGEITFQDVACIDPPPVAGFSVNPEQITTTEPTIQLTNSSAGATTYSWDFGDGEGSVLTHPVHEYAGNESGYTITLTASNDQGCADVATYRVIVIEDLVYYVPNSFTPNGDMFNGVFQPVFTSGFDPYDFQLIIYNRWGEIVFESLDASKGWNGDYNSVSAPDGVYTWQIVFRAKSGGRQEITGSVVLLR